MALRALVTHRAWNVAIHLLAIPTTSLAAVCASHDHFYMNIASTSPMRFFQSTFRNKDASN